MQILHYQYYRAMYPESGLTQELFGTQTIYSMELQDSILQTFCKTDHMVRVYFQADQVILNPSYTCSYLPKQCLVVSNEIFFQYFHSSSENVSFHLVYHIPKVKRVRLKRTNGSFPQQESIEDWLTHYLENNMVINRGQTFNIDYLDGFITFEIQEMEYVTTTETRSVQDRLQEMDDTIVFNLHYFHLSQTTYMECAIQVRHYQWISRTPTQTLSDYQYGDVSFQEVEIDFIDSMPNSVTTIPQTPPNTTTPTQIGTRARTLSESYTESSMTNDATVESSITLSKEELRLKRLQYFNDT